MLKSVLYSALLVLVVMACGKDKFNTKPTIELKSIDPTIVPEGGNLTIKLNYTDKEGDISDSIFLNRVRINKSVVTETNGALPFRVPDFTEKSKGEIQVNLQYELHLKAAQQAPTQIGAPNDKEPDTLVFNIVLRDKAGNTSDTLSTEPIVIIRRD